MALLAGMGAALVSCGSGSTPGGALSGALEPAGLTPRAVLTVGNLQGQVQDVQVGARRVLMGGHLPVDSFAAQKADIAAKVNASAVFTLAQKTEFIAGANSTLDQLEAQVNAALDALPRRMSVAPGGRLGDLAAAKFTFTPINQSPFTVDGLYNTSSTEFLLVNVALERASGNAQGGLLALTGCKFTGRLTATVAEYVCAANGTLVLANSGFANLNVSFTVDLTFKRD